MAASGSAAQRLLLYETEALLHRLGRVLPLVTQIPAVPAAAIAPVAARAIDRFLADGRDALRELVHQYRSWLRDAGEQVDPSEAQRRFALVRLRFNRVLAHFETFADALLQRCEHDYGTLLRGLDVLASDALALAAPHLEPVPLITYLDRGIGAAIRKARTRLPGGGENPVAVIRVPRERMVGSGIGASIVHDVGHQVAASLDLLKALRMTLRAQQAPSDEAALWGVWERWISEIFADLWAVGALGISGTLGLMQVVSLPRAFVFSVHLDDPHPVPWIRVHLSCAMGEALYPHPQWGRLRDLWNGLYPFVAAERQSELVRSLHAHMPKFVALLLEQRPVSCGGKSLRELVPATDRQPARLAALQREWRTQPDKMRRAPPTLAMAVLGQAKFDGSLPPLEESEMHTRLLQRWALDETIAVPTRLPDQTTAPFRRAA